jgi:FKBP-type peptidyl-prolyl cis-trans isomerase FkpA
MRHGERRSPSSVARVTTNARRMLGVLALAGMTACGDDGAGPTEPTEVTFAAATGVNLAQMTKLASGLYVQTLTPGTGTATVTASTRFIAAYTGWIPNGTVFQSATFQQGFLPGELVPGFGEGVIGMKVGEKRKLVIPSRLGYADAPPPASGIPVNSVLIFDVQIVSIS